MDYNQSIIKNIERKRPNVDNLQLAGEIPLFSWLDINPTELCNRKCDFCPRSKGYKNSNKHMDLKLANKISTELKSLNYTGTINISGNGEPLMHKDIVGLVKCFEDFQVEIVTNGDLLKKELVEKLYSNGLKYLVVSMYDGPHQIDKFQKTLKSAGLKEDQYTLRDRWYKEEEGYGLILTNRAGYLNTENKNTISSACFYTHYSIQVDWNGDILLCSHTIYDKSITFGNLNQLSLLNIWNSKEMNNYRKNLEKGERKCLHPCSNCDAVGTMLGQNHANAWKNYLNEEQTKDI